MPKIPEKLEQFRDDLINELWIKQPENFLTAEDLGKIFGLSTSSVYKIIMDHKLISKENP